ncbi:transcription factor bHLH52-like [Humulus lupulus]|uniref:transcription factor bHLH52-like n=1 Tax=Humulus lupulus TaxID=3486 RepID=UPI002B40C275|nr:transcription factor bHLH52-like [Humulus lupulus]
MAALSFCSNNLPACYPNPLHQNLINPDTAVFPQTKKQRSSSSSSSPTLSFPNTNSFTNHVDPFLLQTTNYNNHHQPLFFSNPTNHNPFFSSALSPQPLYSPFEYDYYNPNNNNLDYSGYYGINYYSDQPEYVFNNDHEPYFSVLIPEYDHYHHIDDRLLLAPLLPEQVVVPDNHDRNHNVMMINNNAYNNNYCYHEQAEMMGNASTSNSNAGEDAIHQELKKSSSSSSKVVSPQSMAARERRRKITEKTQELGKLIPGGTKMTTAEMFQAASKYVHFLKAQIALLQEMSKEEALNIKGLEVLGSPIVQEKLYLEDKCLVPKEFVDRASKANQTMFTNGNDTNDKK